jgi:hypothetical protein
MNDPYRFVDELRAEGLNVRLYEGWAARGGPWSAARPVGTMLHHTAAPVPYPLSDLAGRDSGRVKCNANVKQDGTVWLVAYWACNYSSGKGSSVILEELAQGITPDENARARNLVDDIGGNPYFFNIETDHRGDGSPMPLEVELVIAKLATVAGKHYGYTPARIISHAEWTARKIDPYWNGTPRAAIEHVRQLVERGGTMLGPNGEPNWEYVAAWAQGAWSWAWNKGENPLLSDDDPTTPADESSQPRDTVTKQELMAHLQRFEARLIESISELVDKKP